MTFAPASPVISASGLALERGGRVLVRDLGLSVGAGDALVLTGPNGSGKTTLLRALAGLVKPAAGQIVRGAEMAAFLGHLDGLKAAESVGAALRFWTHFHGTSPDRLDAAMDQLAIRHLARRRCSQLSAGQRQRVALVRVALSGRRLWLLDEPAAPLDTRGRALLARLADAHRADGGSIIAATHVDLGWDAVRTLELTS